MIVNTDTFAYPAMILTTEGLGHPPFRDCGTTWSGVTTVVWTGDSCVIRGSFA